MSYQTLRKDLRILRSSGIFFETCCCKLRCPTGGSSDFFDEGMDVPVHHANPFLKVTVCFCKQSGTVRFFSCAYFCKCRSICFSVLGSCVTSSGGIVHIPGVGTGNGVAVGRGVEGRGNAHHSYLFPRSSPFLSLPKKLWVNSRNCICNGLCSEILPDPFSNQGFWKPWKPPLPPRPCF